MVDDISEQLCVDYGCMNLEPVFNDAVEMAEAKLVVGCHPSHFAVVETKKCFAIAFALLQHCYPRQARLGALEGEEFKQGAVVGDGASLFFVVIFNIERIVAAPRASL